LRARHRGGRKWRRLRIQGKGLFGW
jgi:hypothetical protein